MINKNFLFHCGYYDSRIENNIYESHHNFLIKNDSIEGALLEIIGSHKFKALQMHFDGAQEIDSETLEVIQCYDYKCINVLVAQIKKNNKTT